MNPLEPILAQYPIIILDGALATELERRGCDLDDPLWSAKILLEAPHRIRAIHADYLAAGADCLITATYQATFAGFQQRGLTQDEAARLMALSVDLALDARDAFWAQAANRLARPKPIVAASIGPYGAYLADGSEYRGQYGLSKQQLIDFHRPRLAELAKTRADLFAFETIPCLVEAQALTHLLLDFPDKAAWVTFSAKDEQTISQGESFAECVGWLNHYPQIVAVGINCSAPAVLPGLIEQAAQITTKPIIVYPNSGEEYAVDTGQWAGPAGYDDFGSQAQRWHQAGASIIGGCCRTTPQDIAQVAAWARASSS